MAHFHSSSFCCGTPPVSRSGPRNASARIFHTSAEESKDFLSAKTPSDEQRIACALRGVAGEAAARRRRALARAPLQPDWPRLVPASWTECSATLGLGPVLR